jgi:hypothetical protein
MPKEKKNNDEFLLLAKKRLKKAIEADNHNRVQAVEDLRFINGDQWDLGDKKRRENRGRPVLQINVLPKYCKQVSGEMRKNKVKIKVRPVDSKADVHLAKIREGLIYNIEYLSNSESIYDHASKMLVDCGYGAWRVLTRYTDENPFLEEIYMERIENPFSVYLDPEAKDQNFADAEWGFIITKLARDDFKEIYGEDAVPGADLAETPPVGTMNEHWYDKDNVTLAEYFYKEYTITRMALLSDGQMMEKDDAQKYIADMKESYAQIKATNPEAQIDDNNIPTITKERDVEEPIIKWTTITAVQILDEKEWAGKYIPIVLVTGEETNIEGKKYIQGLIRNAKDPQRMLNYWHTSAAETVALAPKAPWMVTAKQIEGYEEDYKSANEDNLPFMKYNIDPANPNARPERLTIGQVPQAIFTEIQRAEQNIKDTIGMYNADVGDQGRELSGKAIFARQMPGDTATYVYPDNMARAIAYGGKIINDLIPHIYDTERDLRLRNVDDTEAFVPVNVNAGKALSMMQENPQKYSGIDKNSLQQTLQKSGPEGKYNDLTAGKYDIVITTGPTFATQRIEAAENMIKIAMSSAKMNPIDKYFTVKNLDFPGSDEYAEAVKKTLPPGIIPPKEGERPPQPLPPPPQMQALMLKTQVEGERMKTEKLKQQVALARLLKETKETDTDVRRTVLNLLAEINAPAHPADNMQMQ